MVEEVRAEPDWWNNSWEKRKNIAFDNSGQSEDLDGFPVLVKLNSSNFDYSKAKPDGTDLRFIDTDDFTQLNYHIEKWNSSGDSFVWIRVPNIPAGSSTDYIWMYYNNSQASDDQDETYTYDPYFMGVWHFNSVNGTYYTPDSTRYGNDGLLGAGFSPNMPSLTEGKVANALKFNDSDAGPDDPDYVRVSNSPTIDLTGNQITLEAWINLNSHNSNNDVVLEKQSDRYILRVNNISNVYRLVFYYTAGEADSVIGNTNISTNKWYYLSGIYNTTHTCVFIDGSQENCKPETDDLNSSLLSLTPAWGGGGAGDFFDGIIDEIRISNTSRSRSWINASYLTMTNQFTIYGPEEGLPSNIIITIESDRMSSKRDVIVRPNTDIQIYGTVFYYNDQSPYVSGILNFSYDNTNLGGNTTDSSGFYSFNFQIPYEGYYNLTVKAKDNGNTGENSTGLNIATHPNYARFRFSYHLGTSKVDDVYRIGTDLMNETIDDLNISNSQYANNLTYGYVCTYDKTEYTSGLVLSLVYSGKKSDLSFVNFSASSTIADYTLELKQKIINTNFLLTYTKGTCEVINDRMYLVESYTIPTRAFSSFSYSMPKEFPVLIQFRDDRISINGTDRFSTGDHKVCIEKFGLSLGNKPMIGVNRC